MVDFSTGAEKIRYVLLALTSWVIYGVYLPDVYTVSLCCTPVLIDTLLTTLDPIWIHVLDHLWIHYRPCFIVAQFVHLSITHFPGCDLFTLVLEFIPFGLFNMSVRGSWKTWEQMLICSWKTQPPDCIVLSWLIVLLWMKCSMIGSMNAVINDLLLQVHIHNVTVLYDLVLHGIVYCYLEGGSTCIL